MTLVLGGAALLLVLVLCCTPLQARDGAAGWKQLSSKTGELPAPSSGTQQTACVVFDIDGDGVNDIVVAERTQAPSVTWLRRTPQGWTRYVIDDTKQRPEAGGCFFDIDGDGDLDLVIGGDAGSDELWWYENPAPDFDPKVPWKRHGIKKGGGRAHHDQAWWDYRGNGKPALAFWNQGAKKLFLAEIPRNPREADSWPLTEIWSYTQDPGGVKQEGMSVFDVDGDGRPDLLAGNHWFRYADGRFIPTRIAPTGGRILAGKFKPGKVPQVVIAPGDGSGPLMCYECQGDPLDPKAWKGRDLLGRTVVHGHSLEVADIDGDGHLDIFAAEMAKWSNQVGAAPDHPQAKSWILYGDGKGSFEVTEFTTGFGFHEARVADVDGDGRPDIVSKPYNWETPRLDIWLNPGRKP
jgi:VCBS repeat protein